MNGGRTGRHLGALALTVGVLSAAGLAACTDDPSPHPSATAPSTTPVTNTVPPSPTATPPTSPKAAPTPESAEAFVKYFWAVYNYAYANRDPRVLEAVSEAQCKFCASTLDDIAQLEKSGAHLEGLTVHLMSAAAPPVEDATRIAIVTVISQDDGRNIRSDGSIQVLAGRKKTQSLVALHWVRNSWQVHGVSIDAKRARP